MRGWDKPLTHTGTLNKTGSYTPVFIEHSEGRPVFKTLGHSLSGAREKTTVSIGDYYKVYLSTRKSDLGSNFCCTSFLCVNCVSILAVYPQK